MLLQALKYVRTYVHCITYNHVFTCTNNMHASSHTYVCTCTYVTDLLPPVGAVCAHGAVLQGVSDGTGKCGLRGTAEGQGLLCAGCGGNR